MSVKLYVGNLSFKTTEQDLADLLGQAGEVLSSVIVKDRNTYESRGFGFVEMGSKEEAAAAIAQFNGHLLDDRTIVVSLARERSPAPGGRRGYSGRQGRAGGGAHGGRHQRHFASRREEKGWWNS